MTAPPPSHRLAADEIDLESLVVARNDSHPNGDWWYDPGTGRSLYLGVDDDTDLAELAGGGGHVLVPDEPQPREDILDFLDAAPSLGVPDRTVIRLREAYRGKGGVRRFRAAVGRTDAVDAWTSYTLRHEACRALEWLLERGLVEESSARARLAAIHDGSDPF